MRRSCVAWVILMSVALAPGLAGEEAAPATRRLWDDAFRRARAGAKEQRSEARAAYLGLTLWRLRRATAAALPEGALRLPLEGEDWWAESVEIGARFAAGERLRLGIESARRGYLYVIDSEQDASGARVAPRLVFPTTRTRGGDNRVSPGRLVEIPDLADTPPYFSLEHGHVEQVAEVLTIFVTPRPLADVRPGREPLAITEAQLARWERIYGAPGARLTLAPGAARAYTRAERDVAASATRRLAHDDPLPQTLFRVDGSAGRGMWVQVSLGMSEGEATR